MKPTRKPTRDDRALADRIRDIRVEIDAIVDERAEAVAKQSPGVPLGVIRGLLTAHSPACPCSQYLEITGAPEGKSED
jgi:hypothetical protein